MAAPDSAINRQLFHELKRQYPEIPDYIVTGFMIQHSNNKNKCLEVLAVESPKHMFGEYSSEASGLSVVQQLGDLGLMDPQSLRQRSDSGSSLKSNASTGSLPCLGSGLVASLASAWPPITVNNPASEASPSIDTSASGKISSPDFSPFLQHSKSTGQIPNIECTTKVASGNRHSAQGSPVSSGQNVPSPHISGYPVPAVSSSASSAVPPQPAPKWTPSPAAYVSQLNSNIYPAGQFSNEIQAHNTGAGHPGVPNISGLAPQHLSQATIYIQSQRKQPQDRIMNPATMPKVAIQPQLQIQQPPANHPGSPIPVHHFISKQDQHSQQQQHVQVAVSANQSNNPLGMFQLGQVNSVASPSNVTTPPFVVQCNYGSRVHVPQQLQVSVSPVSPPTTGAFSTPSNPPSLIYQPTFNPPDIPVRRDIMPSTGVPTVSYPAQTALDMLNYQTFVTTVPHMSNNNAGSPAREDLSSANLYHNSSASVYPTGVPNMGAPGCSHSNLSSEVLHKDSGHVKRPSSQHEEREYIKALLSHQSLRKEKLESDLERETKKLEQIQGQVTTMEQNMAESNVTFPTVEALAKLRDSNRKLLTEIQCMTREIDMYNQGRTPLGNYNAQDEQFFQHLDQGRSPPLPNLGMSNAPRAPHPIPGVTPPTHMPGHTPHRFTQTLPPNRTHKPLPSVPPPVPNITSMVPPAPQTQPHSSSGDSEEGEQWSCTACTFLNHPALNKCECCEMPRVHLGSH